MYMYMYDVPGVQAGLVVARLWACSSEKMSADDVNQYLGWTIAQLSRSVCSYILYMYIIYYCCKIHMDVHVHLKCAFVYVHVQI